MLYVLVPPERSPRWVTTPKPPDFPVTRRGFDHDLNLISTRREITI